MNRYKLFMLLSLGLLSIRAQAAANVIEKQLAEIGSVPNEEVIVVQRKYTRKHWRHEFTPVAFGGVPFGTVRRTLMGGATYTLHVNDWLGLELLNFVYTKDFFSGFTDDINANKPGGLNPNAADIKPDYQKLLYFITTGAQITPFYGKVSTLSRFIAYVEPYFSFGVGLAKTETNQYLTYYPGIGMRMFFKEWFSLKLEFRDYLYSESSTTRTNPPLPTSTLRNTYAVMLSLSFWLPKMPR